MWFKMEGARTEGVNIAKPEREREREREREEVKCL